MFLSISFRFAAGCTNSNIWLFFLFHISFCFERLFFPPSVRKSNNRLLQKNYFKCAAPFFLCSALFAVSILESIIWISTFLCFHSSRTECACVCVCVSFGWLVDCFYFLLLINCVIKFSISSFIFFFPPTIFLSKHLRPIPM